MHEGLTELVVHGLLLLAYTGLAGLLAVGGIAMEYYGYVTAVSGESLLALWLAVIGLVVLVFAYFIVRDKVLVEYRTVRS